MMSLRFAALTLASLVTSACWPSAERDAAGAAPSTTADTSLAAATDSGETRTDGDRILLWGDTHVHSINSIDAFASGLASADIDTAYRYARGMPVVFPKTGQRVQIDRPLDFLVMADHAVSLSASTRLMAREEGIMRLPIARRLLEMFRTEGGRAMTRAQMFGQGLTAEEWAQYQEQIYTEDFLATSWAGQVAAAERHNRPGEFTALIGWEWTSAPGGRNLHRVVFTNKDGEIARQFLPFANYMSDRPEDLWSFFEATRARTGADFVAIPHNPNLSDGSMFALSDSAGEPLTAAYSARRSQWEPVVEITQYKGSSETHPVLSARDEFADFELRNMLLSGEPTEVSGGSYVRTALLRGLAEEARTGRNPFQLGVIGASDSHTGFASMREDDFLGKMGEDFLPRERLGPDRADGPFPNAEMSASGLAGVWADHNDRQSVFDAFRRREVYGTSGPRMSLRLFAGHAFSDADLQSRDFARIGYRKGVPMGGLLMPAAGGRPPQLMIRAVKDPDGANLDRVQVVKGWIDANGQMREKIFNVVWSGDRHLSADGSLPAVGNTVDLATARYRNSIGAAELTVVWADPEFDASTPAFYYVRVLEIPTPRQHVFDALALGIDPATLELPPTIQERAWSSPVWYRP